MKKNLSEAARSTDIRVYGLNEYRTTPSEGEPSFLLGFGGLSNEAIKQAIEDLMYAWTIKKGEESKDSSPSFEDRFFHLAI